MIISLHVSKLVARLRSILRYSIPGTASRWNWVYSLLRGVIRLLTLIFSQHHFEKNLLVKGAQKEFQFLKFYSNKGKKEKGESLTAGFAEVHLFGRVCSWEEGSSSWKIYRPFCGLPVSL